MAFSVKRRAFDELAAARTGRSFGSDFTFDGPTSSTNFDDLIFFSIFRGTFALSGSPFQVQDFFFDVQASHDACFVRTHGIAFFLQKSHCPRDFASSISFEGSFDTADMGFCFDPSTVFTLVFPFSKDTSAGFATSTLDIKGLVGPTDFVPATVDGFETIETPPASGTSPISTSPVPNDDSYSFLALR